MQPEWPADKVERRSVAALIPYARNARTHSAEQVDQIAASIRAFVGSGTTIIAAEMTARACHAIELSPAYVDVAVTRWQNFTGQTATLEATGAAFEAKSV